MLRLRSHRTFKTVLRAAVLIGSLAFTTAASQAADPLPSWNAGPAKQSIITFVVPVRESLPVTAIDILLEPDAAMLRHAEAVNANLLKIFPQGFGLDAAHRPHVTMIQRFVRTADLDKVYAAAGKVFASANVAGMKLEAFKYYYAASNDLGVPGIVVRPTPELLKLQENLIAAVAPFTVPRGASAAFVTTPDDH
jgi:hypothetical protein